MTNVSFDVILTIVGGIVAFAKWVYEYSKKNKWDKNKYLVECIDDFRSKEAVKAMEKILDWNSIKFGYKGTIVKTNDAEIYGALFTHDVKSNFTSQEVMLREIFDTYFDELTKLIILTKCDLISEKNLMRFMGYWFDILNGDKKSKSPQLLAQIHEYLIFYGYTELKEFLNNLND